MKITKFGHACLLLQEKGVRILIDPGSYSEGYRGLQSLDVLLITHEHIDHIDEAGIRELAKNNPAMKIFTNKGAGKVLEKAGIPFTLLENGQKVEIKGVSLEGYGEKHAPVHNSMPVADNTGYFIADRFFYPGDAFVIPPRPVEILGLPTGGPWLKLGEVVDYVKKVHPQVCFPVHDAMFRENLKPSHFLSNLVPPLGIKFIELKDRQESEF